MSGHQVGVGLARSWASRKGCSAAPEWDTGTLVLVVKQGDHGAELGRLPMGAWDGIPCVPLDKLAGILEPLPDRHTGI